MITKFKDDQQKRDNIIAALQQLKENTGWKVIIKALEENIKQAEVKLHGEIPLEKDETIEYWQKIRSDRLQVMELPDTIIEENKEKDAFDPLLDPYD